MFKVEYSKSGTYDSWYDLSSSIHDTFEKAAEEMAEEIDNDENNRYSDYKYRILEQSGWTVIETNIIQAKTRVVRVD